MLANQLPTLLGSGVPHNFLGKRIRQRGEVTLQGLGAQAGGAFDTGVQTVEHRAALALCQIGQLLAQGRQACLLGQMLTQQLAALRLTQGLQQHLGELAAAHIGGQHLEGVTLGPALQAIGLRFTPQLRPPEHLQYPVGRPFGQLDQQRQRIGHARLQRRTTADIGDHPGNAPVQLQALQGIGQQRCKRPLLDMHVAQHVVVDPADLGSLCQAGIVQALGQNADAPQQLATLPMQRLFTLELPGAVTVVFERRLEGVVVVRVPDSPLLKTGIIALLVQLAIQADVQLIVQRVLPQGIGRQALG